MKITRNFPRGTIIVIPDYYTHPNHDFPNLFLVEKDYSGEDSHIKAYSYLKGISLVIDLAGFIVQPFPYQLGDVFYSRDDSKTYQLAAVNIRPAPEFRQKTNRIMRAKYEKATFKLQELQFKGAGARFKIINFDTLQNITIL